MCLIAFAWRMHPRWRLVLVGNRDEFHARPTAPLASWDEAPEVHAGRDLEAGGTWAGLAAHGRVGVITNVRDLTADHSGLSRGLLVADYLSSNVSAATHAGELLATAKDYRPFNLLTFDQDHAYYLGNHPEARQQEVMPGIHGLSNADFNAPWPKTQALVGKLEHWVRSADESIDTLFDMVSDQGRWPDDLLPDTGIGIERERFLSSAFIVGEHYGTRASTVILVGYDDASTIVERRFGPHGSPEGESRFDLATA